jgi:hypothetical protein
MAGNSFLTKSNLSRTAGLLLIAIAAMFAASCSLSGQRPAPDSMNYEPFIAPSLVPTATATLTPTPTATPEPSTNQAGNNEVQNRLGCTDNLKFISDVTIPDGTTVEPGSTLDKQWEVENNGTCNWDEFYTVRLINDQALSAKTEQALMPARGGSRVTIQITFHAPHEVGSYHTAWQAYNPQGEPFGDPFYMDVVVEEGDAAQ